MVTFGVLGPLTADDDHGPVKLGGARHRAVLARLLIARGRVVPVSWLIDDLWEERREGALGAVQTFVGALRKALEPGRPPRTPARLLVTSPPGYALRAEPEAVDAWRFESAVAGAARLPAEEAYTLLTEALGLWRGPAYAEFAEQDWARGEAARLDELRLLAVERRAEAALASGRAAETVPDLEAHVAGHPLREDGWRLLALGLYRRGRQGDALAQLRRAREVLRTELGVDPGEALRRLESDILLQSPHLTDTPPSAPSTPRPAGAPASGPVPASGAASASRPESPPSGSSGAEPGGHPFVGRVAELGELEGVAADVVAHGRARLVLVSGAAGAGKTSLAGMLARRLTSGGWTAAWGASPELRGAPAAWPWTQMRDQLTAAGHLPPEPSPADPHEPPGAPGRPGHREGRGEARREGRETDRWEGREEGGPEGRGGVALAARFRRRRAIAAGLAEVAGRAPLLLVFDDLHWADEETLALLTTLAGDLGAAPVLIVGTYRSTEISAGLSEALGRISRAEPARVYLGGLTEPQVRELVQTITGRDPGDGGAARTIHARSGGNPFFVRELTRLWESEGDAALHTVPAGVRDVIRHRLAGLSEAARTHLRQAAVVGQEVDLDVLIPLAGDEDEVLDSVESALIAGFLVERDADRLRFAHALVHETLYDDVTRARRARWHARAAEIVERVRPGDVETIAHHCVRAGGRADAARTARYARAAAERAERRSAPHEAARLWRATLDALDRATPAGSPDGGAKSVLPGGGTVRGAGEEWPGGEVVRTGGGPVRLEAVMGLVRALAVIGELHESRRHRAEAAAAAEALGDPVLAARVIGAFDVPAVWTANDDPALSARLAAAAERTLAALPPTGHDAERARLLITIAMERRADPARRGAEAAREAEAIARRLGDRTLLAYALNGRYMQTFERAGLAPERAAIGAEMLEVAAGDDGLVTFEVLGHLVLLQARAALADLEAADRHAAAADRLAERYDLPLVGVFTTWYAALRLAVRGGGGDAARAAYRTAAARLSGTGMPGVEEGILPLALLCLRVAEHDPGAPGAASRKGAGHDLDVPGAVSGTAAGARRAVAGHDPGVPGAMGDRWDGTAGRWGPYEAWGRALTLFGEGRREEAVRAVAAIPDSPQDLLFEARTGLHAVAAVTAGDRAAMERLHERLLPAEDELAGAGSGLVTLGPVALYLGRLAAALGRHEQAAGHFRKAEEVAGRAGAPHWAAAARAAATR
ncbi:BTAD domain-containing putative transcriptional regulator [Nonomuraea candida]|uniref:BTAD domain-containing putative transcriptional regulator n=1 Tax=Nonomuraea candida TaxID=359159 RepID=UPI0005BA45FC|nr:BTAD domain-containing putative transcriptional regulator [Nonomuraea candida]